MYNSISYVMLYNLVNLDYLIFLSILACNNIMHGLNENQFYLRWHTLAKRCDNNYADNDDDNNNDDNNNNNDTNRGFER